MDGVCNKLNTFVVADSPAMGLKWYASNFTGKTTCEINPTGCELKAYCKEIVQRNEEGMVEKAQTVQRSVQFQNYLCVQREEVCHKHWMQKWAQKVIESKKKAAHTDPAVQQQMREMEDKKIKKMEADMKKNGIPMKKPPKTTKPAKPVKPEAKPEVRLQTKTPPPSTQAR